MGGHGAPGPRHCPGTSLLTAAPPPKLGRGSFAVGDCSSSRGQRSTGPDNAQCWSPQPTTKCAVSPFCALSLCAKSKPFGNTRGEGILHALPVLSSWPRGRPEGIFCSKFSHLHGLQFKGNINSTWDLGVFGEHWRPQAWIRALTCPWWLQIFQFNSPPRRSERTFSPAMLAVLRVWTTLLWEPTFYEWSASNAVFSGDPGKASCRTPPPSALW